MNKFEGDPETDLFEEGLVKTLLEGGLKKIPVERHIGRKGPDLTARRRRKDRTPKDEWTHDWWHHRNRSPQVRLFEGQWLRPCRGP